MGTDQAVFRYKCDHCGVETQWRFGDGTPQHWCIPSDGSSEHWHIATVPENEELDALRDELTLLLEDARDKIYVHQQDIPSEVWLVEHNLGKIPMVTVLDSLGRQIWGGEIDHLSNNSLTITFGGALAGTAHLD